MFDPTAVTPGLEEAILDALRDILRNNLSILNKQLQRDVYTSFLPPVMSEDVDVGGIETVWDIGDPSDDPQHMIQICVIPGDIEGGHVMTGDRYEFGTPGTGWFKGDFYTTIHAYIHPKVWTLHQDRAFNRKAKVKIPCRLLTFLRGGVFNNYQPVYNTDTTLASALNTDIPLTSTEYNSVGVDHFTNCMVKATSCGEYRLSWGEDAKVFGAHVVHCGTVI